MVRKVVSATVSAALCLLSVAPGMAVAQEYRFSGFDAPRGATATLNLRVPLGTDRRPVRQRMSYGLTLGYGQSNGALLDGRETIRAARVADLRFNTNGELRNARLASFDLANPGRNRAFSDLNGQVSTVWIVVGVVAAGVAVCLLADCFGDDEEDMPN